MIEFKQFPNPDVVSCYTLQLKHTYILYLYTVQAYLAIMFIRNLLITTNVHPYVLLTATPYIPFSFLLSHPLSGSGCRFGLKCPTVDIT